MFLSGCTVPVDDISDEDNDSVIPAPAPAPNNVKASDISLEISWEIDAAGGTSPSGFYVYYGKNSGNLTTYVDVGMTTLANLNGEEFIVGEINQNGTDTYYFSVVSYDADKVLFSAPSEESAVTL